MLFDLGYTLAQLKVRLKARVDREAEARMAVYLTPGSALGVEYVNTEADARRWQADDAAGTLGPDADYAFVLAEQAAQVAAGNAGTTMADAVDIILTQVAAYQAAAATIKEQRRGAKLQIDAATTIPDARAAAVVTWAA